VIMFILVVPRETLEVSRTLFMANYSFFNVYLMQSKNSIYLMTLFGMGNFSPIFIYIFRQYFKSISKDIEEQANIDGAGIFRTFWRIMLPNAKGAILTVGLFSFIWTYNDSYYPSLFNFSTNSFELLSTKLANGRYSNINTTALLIIIPLLLIYVVTQKYFIEAIERSVIY
ncbi:MAG: ABC transporter permease subunit, partial [Bacilli bacterium]|nr:ABC transporter permease subunit [Bacilli bacterium]